MEGARGRTNEVSNSSTDPQKKNVSMVGTNFGSVEPDTFGDVTVVGETEDVCRFLWVSDIGHRYHVALIARAHGSFAIPRGFHWQFSS